MLNLTGQEMVPIASKLGKTVEELRNSRILVNGATGFIGSWIVNFLEFLNFEFDYKIEIIAPTRNLKNISKNAHRVVGTSYLHLDYRFVNSYNFGSIDFVFNGATSSHKKSGSTDEIGSYAATINSTKNIIINSVRTKSKPRVINLSSGAVYEPQNSPQLERDVPYFNSNEINYRQSKIESEKIIHDATNSGIIQGSNLRLFAFFGPGLPLNEHFAIGNFVRDALYNTKVHVLGNPNTTRSYMYSEDLIVWLFKGLLTPFDKNYNIGSEYSLSIQDLANIISEMFGNLPVVYESKQSQASCYVPSTVNFRKDYGVTESISLSEGLRKWIDFIVSNS